MADAIISVVATRALSILEQQIRSEVNLVRGVKKEVRDLSGKLGTIRTVLDDAEKRGVKEPSVKQWLKKLEDAAYEMEDILDEWSYALVNHKMEQSAKQKEKVYCSFIPSPSSCLCFKNLAVRHDIGIKIRDAKVKLDEILIEKDQFKFVTSLPPPSDVEPTPPPRVQSISSIDQAKVHGLDIHRNKNKIVRRLMDDSSSELLSIVGMGGLGKTTLAQLVFSDTQVKNSFDLCIWICVSDPFDVAKIAREIVTSVGRETIPQDTNQLELVLQKLRDSILDKKFLLVLDDVWTETHQEWEPLEINLGHGAAGSKILVTSRNMRVAKMMGSSDHQIYYPEHLSDEECWSLLQRLSLPGRSEEECKEFKGVGMKIAGKCKGLPLAANVLGRLLQFKDVKLEAWENVLESEIWQLEEAKVELFPHLLLSYNELSPALKRCFSYCAVYPKDSEIDVEILIEEWMAQGYLGSVRGNGRVEVKGRDNFNNLAMRSLFQDIKKSDDGSIYQCKMHDIVHDFALFLRKNDVAAALTKSSCQVCIPLLVSQVQEYRSLVWDRNSPRHVCDCLTSVRVLRFECGLPQGMKKLIHLRRLELSGYELSEEDLKIIFKFYFLQTLLLPDCSFEKIPIEIGNLVELRHLDLSYNPEQHSKRKLKELPSEIWNLVELRHLNISGNGELTELPSEIGNLVELRHLDLSFNEKLKELPESVCSLVELRILNLNWCRHLEVLPEGIHRLRNLHALHIRGTSTSYCLPRGLGELSCLCTLENEYVDGRTIVCNLGLLKKLNSLSGSLDLDIKIPSSSSSDVEELVKDAQEADLRSKIHIHTLDIGFRKDEVEGSSSSLWMEGMEALEPNQQKLNKQFIKDDVEGSSSSLWMEVMKALEPNLQKLNKLTIHGYRASRLSEWISSPLSLVKAITLYDCYELSSLPPLGKLPCLELLRIYDLHELKFVGREFLGIESSSSSSFPKLKRLSIKNLWKWSEWEDITAEEDECGAISIMPCLEELRTPGCVSLKKLPHRLLRKASSSLRILNISGSTLLKSQYEDKEGSEWRSISQYNPHLQLRLSDVKISYL